ncbi:MAG: biotin/lipoyl-binding protein [Chlamydiae bacterium]|nr:biotin/lipoyl-binding protein [Chlamydiota bacterium]MBI3267137.1 biotin/lipoyl-binding protein [Chlamydiota bacterium]
MRKIIVILAVFFVVIVGVSGIKVLISKDKNRVSSELEKQPHVEVQIPLKKDMNRILVLPGDVVADQEVIIYGHVSGYLDRLEVDRGSWVKEGQVLAQIQIPELMKELEAQKAALALAPLEIKKAKADWTWKKAQYERARELIKKSPNLISQDQVDELKGKYAMARAELKVTKGRYPVLNLLLPTDV